MLKAGFVQKWKADFWPALDRCSSTAYGGTGQQKKVDLDDMQGSFYLLLLGEHLFCAQVCHVTSLFNMAFRQRQVIFSAVTA